MSAEEGALLHFTITDIPYCMAVLHGRMGMMGIMHQDRMTPLHCNARHHDHDWQAALGHAMLSRAILAHDQIM